MALVNEKNPNCFDCKYLRITRDPYFPRSCLLFGFKGQELPSVTVKKSTGEICQYFAKKLNSTGMRGQ